jgi:hypothetical protein
VHGVGYLFDADGVHSPRRSRRPHASALGPALGQPLGKALRGA